MGYEKKIKTIEHFEGHDNEINIKGILILVLNIFIIVSIITLIGELATLVSPLHLSPLKVVTSLILLFSIFSILITVYTITPYLNSSKKSFLFFNNIPNSHKKEETTQDIKSQINDLEKGLKRKHQVVKMALLINIIQLLFLTYITYITVL
ncbi:hypothetical protein ATO12_17810 [Aquimarina atlantica]|uniref:Pycsar effector protein domain-containing protein n=1 Tax=Aquimarina atlantica TaxID=1317122 RepID=A0A023BV23_9FLAO|nr:hypothetical protein [Aquimarina atlantica]EZH73789.1 hypothetical protein ATO12_17810 [Aquimarina atlantica]